MTKRPSRRVPAFTLVELLVVIAIVAVVAALLFPALGQAKARGRAVQCLNQVRQLTLAWMLYADDHDGALVPNADGSASGKQFQTASWAGGWLEFSGSLDNVNLEFLLGTPRGHGGKLGPYLHSPRVFRCPEDRSQITLFGRVFPRARSYSLNCYMNGGHAPHLGSWQRPELVTFRRYDDIRRPAPSRAFLFLDEREDSINDGYFAMDVGREVIVDYPGGYHGGGATTSFADGHAEHHRWQDARTTPPLERGTHLRLNVPSPGNRDMAWLHERATAPRPGSGP